MLHDSKSLPFDPTNPTGFPSPAGDFCERSLDLNEHLIQNKAATFFMYAETEAMTASGIQMGSLLIVDRSLKPSSGHIIVGVLEGDFYLRRLVLAADNKNKGCTLVADTGVYEDIVVTEQQDFHVWGVVAAVIHKFEGHEGSFSYPEFSGQSSAPSARKSTTISSANNFFDVK